ncbi:MAG: discoidin domain-containing protein [Phycisphaerae bacterium]|nr:discoidin domain-containing protein [Phycisphaerae bacterium]
MMCRRLILLVLMLGIAATSAQAAVVISSVAHRNTDSDATEDPQIGNPLADGELTFVDRVHVYMDMPDYLIGADYVMTANDNKNWSAYELDITFSRPATLFVFVDNRMGGAAGGLDVAPNIDGMSWLTDMGFIDTDDDIGIDEGADGGINQYYSIFALDVSAGTVTIFGNTEGHGGNMLGVAAIPRTPDFAAYNPVPEDGGTDVVRTTSLSWTPGAYAGAHNIYLGTSFADVNDATTAVQTGLDVNSFAPDRFEFGQTYYWRVDEINATPDRTVFKGDIWSFEVEPYSVMVPVDVSKATASSFSPMNPPEMTVNGSGLDGMTHSTVPEAMWLSAAADSSPWLMYEFDQTQKLDQMLVWNANSTSEGFVGWGIKDVNIEYSLDGVEWTALAESPQMARAPGNATYDAPQAVDFGLARAKYVKINILTNWGGLLPQYGVAEVQFFAIPTVARTPNPASGTQGVDPRTDVLSWRAGREAGQHDVFVSEDANALGSAHTVLDNRLALSSLNLSLGTTYYWQVDEVNDAMVPSTWTSDVWNFSTPSSLVVEDFERYTNLSPDRPFQTWLDGYGYSADEYFPVEYPGNGTGAGIGHDIWSPSSPQFNGSLMETASTAPGSSQSMPFYYGNSGGVASQTSRTFASPQDWTIGKAKTLSIAIRGQAGNSGTLFAMINNAKMSYAQGLDSALWHYFNIDLSSVNTNLQSVTKLTIGIDGSNASGMILIDDIRLYPEAGPVDPGSSGLPLIAWVSFHGDDTMPSAAAADAGFTEAPDKAYTDLLTANGYEVMRYVTTNAPDADVLSAVDLVIISRSVASSGYQDAGASAWNSIATPMIITDGYTTRSSRMGFTAGDTIPDTAGDITLKVNNPSHPIFAGIELAGGTMVNPFAGVVVYPTDGTTVARGISVNTDPINVDGTLLATVATTGDPAVGGMIIGEWQAGAALIHTGGGGTDTLAGDRLVFLTGAREANGISGDTAGLYDLYDDGATMFLNAVAYMLRP